MMDKIKERPLRHADSIFYSPPENPMIALHLWIEHAMQNDVDGPYALALATTNSEGKTSNRIVRILEIKNDNILFTSHANSQKAKDITVNNWASGLLYWRETKQQIILSGEVEKLPDDISTKYWEQRPFKTCAMSVSSSQSEVLKNENELRAKAQRVIEAAIPLSRPASWCGYMLKPKIIEFWQAASDQLHLRLRYDATENGWSNCRLQP